MGVGETCLKFPLNETLQQNGFCSAVGNMRTDHAAFLLLHCWWSNRKLLRIEEKLCQLFVSISCNDMFIWNIFYVKISPHTYHLLRFFTPFYVVNLTLPCNKFKYFCTLFCFHAGKNYCSKASKFKNNKITLNSSIKRKISFGTIWKTGTLLPTRQIL